MPYWEKYQMIFFPFLPFSCSCSRHKILVLNVIAIQTANTTTTSEMYKRPKSRSQRPTFKKPFSPKENTKLNSLKSANKTMLTVTKTPPCAWKCTHSHTHPFHFCPAPKEVQSSKSKHMCCSWLKLSAVLNSRGKCWGQRRGCPKCPLTEFWCVYTT